MRTVWFHLSAEIPPDVEAAGPEAVESEAAKQYDVQSRQQHGIPFVELQELVDDAVAGARTGLPKTATEADVRAAVDAAAQAVFASFSTPTPAVQEAGDA